jgi:hypothetical protein
MKVLSYDEQSQQKTDRRKNAGDRKPGSSGGCKPPLLLQIIPDCEAQKNNSNIRQYQFGVHNKTAASDALPPPDAARQLNSVRMDRQRRTAYAACRTKPRRSRVPRALCWLANSRRKDRS